MSHIEFSTIHFESQ